MNKYVYETEDKIKMELILNLDKVYKSLKNFKDCYERIYNGKDYRSTKKYYYKGKIYTEEELIENNFEKDEEGIYGCMPIYTEEEILTKIKDYLYDVWNLIE